LGDPHFGIFLLKIEIIVEEDNVGATLVVTLIMRLHLKLLIIVFGQPRGLAVAGWKLLKYKLINN
jgi:hypothetical protein